MSKMQDKKQRQSRTARLEIVAEMYLRQHTHRQIQAEVMRRLRLESYSLGSVHNDIKYILAELQRERLDNIEEAVQMELARIDTACNELWVQWAKSKAKGAGNVTYISEIRQQLQERRKLLGLYSPEKSEVTATTKVNARFDASAIPDDLLFAVADKLQEDEHRRVMAEKGEAYEE
ncbi:MAG: hypothetical protein NC344_06825 [Bacteroidales bacterium]|nr:hypothetical protein [Bacteroidales bacterium]MCM1147530.1 hypothetical protein [Bacteroidales bacterium]MCM1206320.1 hypothetical protein [Bacillota bacterium]MCM1511252.1 hypothetical protein [Clostridium sp.]